LVYGAASGLVRALKDPYSEFLPPQETKQFQEDIKGSFEGIGAEIGIRKEVLTIISPLKDSPAEKAGLKGGDKVLKINDTTTADLALDEAVRLIRGPKGTEVKLIVLRDSFDKVKEIKIIRDTIRIIILTTEKKNDGIFVIKLNHFTQNAAWEFRKAVQEFYQSGSQKLILDMRNNPGGFLNVAVDIASWFLPAGEVVTKERVAEGEREIYRSAGYKLLEKVPTVVLVNEGSASASEIVAGALRDVRGIKLVGTKTFGKGSVQEVVPLPEGASLKITVAKWLTPKGQEINGKGLEPDVKVELPKEEEKAEEKDWIMEKGIEVVKGL
jgi:carboxyl-terminal processing protease